MRVISWGFESPSPHHFYRFRRNLRETPSRIRYVRYLDRFRSLGITSQYGKRSGFSSGAIQLPTSGRAAMRRTLQRLVLSLAISAAPAFAATFTVNNTGGAAPGVVDPNWMVGVGQAFVTDDGGFPFNVWLTNSVSSSWISPQPSYTSFQTDAPDTSYTYSTMFDLTGLNEATASITFLVAVDNDLTDVLINGVSTGLSYGVMAAFSGPLTINSGFIAGMNTLTFVTFNAAGHATNPSGLRVEFTSATVDAVVPEPSSIALLGLGILLFASRRLHRKP